MMKSIEKPAVVGAKWALPFLATLFALAVCAGAKAQLPGKGAELLRELDNAYVEIWNRVAPAVVNVDTERVITLPELPPFFREFFRDFGVRRGEKPRSRTVQGRASGFVIDKQGHILTNFHVVEGAGKITVRFSGEEEPCEATLVGTDRETDIALIKIEAKRELPAAKLGDSESLRVGQIVMAIGNPAGTLERTFTVGHVSGLSRVLPEFGQRMRLAYGKFIQTDAAINLGNSGGPLVNIDGEVIGINTAWAPGGENIGFAVPINFAKDILPDLKESGKAIRGHLGVRVSTLPPGAGDEYALPDDKGALVQSVTPGSPAEEAGLKRYDVITEVDRQEIDSMDDLVRVITHLRPGTTVRVTFFRDKKPRTVRMKLAERPVEIAEEETAEEAQPEKTLGIGGAVRPHADKRGCRYGR